MLGRSVKTGAKKKHYLYPFWESKTEEPAWVADDDIWQKAKKTAAKSYNQDDPAYWPSVATIYSKMGGTKKSEADGASSTPQVLRSRESAPPVPSTIRLRESTTFREAIPTETNPEPNQSRFSTAMLQEGMGNFTSRFYYTKEALDSAPAIFEGKKIFADHPTEEEEQIRPERSVRDILGYYEGVKVVQESDGHSVLVSNVNILSSKDCDWARDRMREAVEYSKKYPDQDFIGLSINAQGNAEEVDIDDFMAKADIPKYCMEKLQKAKEAGIDKIRVVSKFVNAISCDLVTEAGAGGRVTKMIEGDTMAKKKKKTMEADQKHPAGGAPEAKEAGDDGHDDAAQDKELIKSMLKKHLGKDKDGKDQEPSEADMKLAGECMKMAKAKGLEGEEAEKEAVAAMGHVQSYGAMKQAEAEAEESEESDESEESTESESEETDEASETEESAAPVAELEALKKDNVKLRGKVAMYEKADRKREIAAHLDKILADSGEERKVTNAFREALSLEKVKSKEEIDERWKDFQEGYRMGRQEVGFNDIVITTEKRGGEPTKTGLDLSKCIG
jgi:hypothetical protein